MKRFVTGIVVGAVAVLGLDVFLSAGTEDRPVRFPGYMMMVYPNWIQMDGSLVGDGEDRPLNNFYSIECRREQMSCEVLAVNQIGPSHVAFPITEVIPITEWNEEALVASSRPLLEGTQGCNYYLIKMDLVNRTADYERWPREDAGELCADFYEEKVMRWRFDNGPAWYNNADGSERVDPSSS